MYTAGIDIGSTYTKYCVMDENRSIVKLFSEKTPVRQKEYFESMLRRLTRKYSNITVVSCGYGKRNVSAVKNLNELTALAKGADFIMPDAELVLDIGGQDTKIISQADGRLKEFFVNDKCAAGSGMFLANTCRLLETEFEKIDLSKPDFSESEIHLSSVCAVFAQSEIISLLADNIDGDRILRAVIRHILTQAKSLLGKIKDGNILLSGGLTQIRGFKKFASLELGRTCIISENSSYLSAIGAALYGFREK